MEIGTIIDALVLFFLGVTIFYAWRLSTYMRIFRDSRDHMARLLATLDANIACAEKSVLGMRNAAENAGHRLNEIVKESRFLADELKFMNEAGDSLAGRLERLAEKNRILVQEIEAVGGVTAHTPYKNATSAPVEEEDEPLDETRNLFSVKQAANEPGPDLISQAERDLYEALQRRRGER